MVSRSKRGDVSRQSEKWENSADRISNVSLLASLGNGQPALRARQILLMCTSNAAKENATTAQSLILAHALSVQFRKILSQAAPIPMASVCASETCDERMELVRKGREWRQSHKKNRKRRRE